MAGMGLIQLLIAVIIIAGCIGIALIAVRASGVAIPSWVMSIFWIVVVCTAAIFAIRFLAGV